MPRVVLQDLGHGKTWIEEVAKPNPGPADVLIATGASVVSPGTERMLADFGRASLLGKARSQPQRVAEVIDKARSDGLAPTLQAVRSRLARPVPLGYSSAGTVVEVGADVRGIHVGDRVAAAGPHAELASVPANLATPLPDGLELHDAAFATLASVAMQGLRLAEPSAGERFAVSGLGLVGLLAVQLLTAQGCTVLGIDPDPARRTIAERFGIRAVDPDHDVVGIAADLTRGMGVDGVLICATTPSSEPVHQAAGMCRQRGRIVLVGVTGLELQRSDFYEKELTFQVSASYGPGRYDPLYEEGGVDYPAGLVRWTAGRNLESVIDLMASGRLDVGPLVTHEHPFDDAAAAYETLVSDPSALGIVLRYPEPDLAPESPLLRARIDISSPTAGPGAGNIGVIGAGNFASQVLLPAIVDAGGHLRTVVSARGTSASLAAERHRAAQAGSEPDDVFDDPEIDTVVIATRHDSHARYVERALRAGKHTFVEKPLAISFDELDSLRRCITELDADGRLPLLGMGFNRRFAPIPTKMKKLLATQQAPKALVLTMNAGWLPPDHWTQDPKVGGGRIVGEACHLIDLARFLVGAPITEVRTSFLDTSGPRDTATISLGFADGSIATVNYFANGSKRYPKERIEVFSGGRVMVDDNHRSLKTHGWPWTLPTRLLRPDKGHRAGIGAFLAAVRSGGPAPIPLDEILEVAEAGLRAADPG
ncbi:MAG: bi-domain-containing oxidoreductase [Acidimicrobiales bacterium]